VRWVVVFGLAGATLAVGVWVLSGDHWPWDKMTAGQTAVYLKRQSRNWRTVHCTKGEPGWDYKCTFTTLFQGKILQDSIGVKVDATKVTNQTAP
jgi:hypothetical protein